MVRVTDRNRLIKDIRRHVNEKHGGHLVAVFKMAQHYRAMSEN